MTLASSFCSGVPVPRSPITAKRTRAGDGAAARSPNAIVSRPSRSSVVRRRPGKSFYVLRVSASGMKSTTGWCQRRGESGRRRGSGTAATAEAMEVVPAAAGPSPGSALGIELVDLRRRRDGDFRERRFVVQRIPPGDVGRGRCGESARCRRCRRPRRNVSVASHSGEPRPTRSSKRRPRGRPAGRSSPTARAHAPAAGHSPRRGRQTSLPECRAQTLTGDRARAPHRRRRAADRMMNRACRTDMTSSFSHRR